MAAPLGVGVDGVEARHEDAQRVARLRLTDAEPVANQLGPIRLSHDIAKADSGVGTTWVYEIAIVVNVVSGAVDHAA